MRHGGAGSAPGAAFVDAEALYLLLLDQEVLDWQAVPVVATAAAGSEDEQNARRSRELATPAEPFCLDKEAMMHDIDKFWSAYLATATPHEHARTHLRMARARGAAKMSAAAAAASSSARSNRATTPQTRQRKRLMLAESYLPPPADGSLPLPLAHRRHPPVTDATSRVVVGGGSNGALGALPHAELLSLVALDLRRLALACSGAAVQHARVSSGRHLDVLRGVFQRSDERRGMALDDEKAARGSVTAMVTVAADRTAVDAGPAATTTTSCSNGQDKVAATTRINRKARGRASGVVVSPPISPVSEAVTGPGGLVGKAATTTTTTTAAPSLQRHHRAGGGAVSANPNVSHAAMRHGASVVRSSHPSWLPDKAFVAYLSPQPAAVSNGSAEAGVSRDGRPKPCGEEEDVSSLSAISSSCCLTVRAQRRPFLAVGQTLSLSSHRWPASRQGDGGIGIGGGVGAGVAGRIQLQGFRLWDSSVGNDAANAERRFDDSGDAPWTASSRERGSLVLRKSSSPQLPQSDHHRRRQQKGEGAIFTRVDGSMNAALSRLAGAHSLTLTPRAALPSCGAAAPMCAHSMLTTPDSTPCTTIDRVGRSATATSIDATKLSTRMQSQQRLTRRRMSRLQLHV
jgi:hypothetical protein